MTTARLVIVVFVLNILLVIGGVAANYMMIKRSGPFAGLAPVAAAVGEPELAPGETIDYEFHPVNKIIISVPGDGREHYFVLDLSLQAIAEKRPRNYQQVEPLVRNSVVNYLSTLKYQELRGLQIEELQARLEKVLFADFAAKQAAVPFRHVLVSKMIVQ